MSIKWIFILICAIILQFQLVSQEAVLNEQDSIIELIIGYYKQPKPQLDIYDAREKLIKAKGLLAPKDPLLNKLHLAYGRMNTDTKLLEEANILTRPILPNPYIAQSLVGSIIAILFLLWLCRHLFKTRRKLKKDYQGLNQKYDQIIGVEAAYQEKCEEHDSLQSKYKKAKALNDTYAPIVSVDKAKQEKEMELSTIEDQIKILKRQYQEASILHKELKHNNALIRDDIDIAEFGLYEPHFDYDASEKFKIQIKLCREDQKALVRSNDHIQNEYGRTVKGHKKEKQIMLRAFNGECDSFIQSVSWSNIKRMEERIERSRDAINKMNDEGLYISREYLSLKLKELRLTHEYELKKHEEKEAQRRIREQMREEEKAQKEYEKAIKEAEKEEQLYLDAMRKAEARFAQANEIDKLRYKTELDTLQRKLIEAQEKNKRALSLAQQTKSGHIYVISNIGSFGDNIYKIGMTRRFDPMVRIKELGDASVPYTFDVHAMIESDNAPELEATLHNALSDKRVNLVNMRKEYFKVELDEIQKIVHEHKAHIEFIIEPEAKEYRESQAIRGQEDVIQKKKITAYDLKDIDDLFSES